MTEKNISLSLNILDLSFFFCKDNPLPQQKGGAHYGGLHKIGGVRNPLPTMIRLTKYKQHFCCFSNFAITLLVQKFGNWNSIYIILSTVW